MLVVTFYDRKVKRDKDNTHVKFPLLAISSFLDLLAFVCNASGMVDELIILPTSLVYILESKWSKDIGGEGTLIKCSSALLGAATAKVAICPLKWNTFFLPYSAGDGHYADP